MEPAAEQAVDPGRRCTFVFVGVTTGSSSIRRIFPRWMEILGLPEIQLEGIDHPLHDSTAAYRATVQRVKDDPQCTGGLITAHKIDLAEAAGDLFDWLDPYAQRTGEISCMAKNPVTGALEGYARDPISAGLTLEALLGRAYFAAGAGVFCVGAGGSGTAITLHLCSRPDPDDRPGRIILVDRDEERLARVQAMLSGLKTDTEVELLANADPQVNDALLGQLPAGSLVVNASGMGKDLPGSPLTDAAQFPEKGIAWEINYRGALDFWHQAKEQQAARQLVVEDGWRYFLHGWTQHVATVLHLEMSGGLFSRLAEAAAPLRPDPGHS